MSHPSAPPARNASVAAAEPVMENSPPPRAAPPLQYPKALTSETAAGLNAENWVVVIANDGATRFACARSSLVRFSKLYRALAQASDMDELPLRCSAATPEVTALVCTWMNHYAEGSSAAAAAAAAGSDSTASSSSCADALPSRITYPLQPGNNIACFLNSYDARFVEQLVFKQSGGISGNCGRIYALAITATFLQAQILVELCSGVFAFNIREAELASRPVQAPSGESMIRSWFGLSGDFSAQERHLILEQNRDLRDPQGVLEKIKELSDEAHDTAAALVDDRVAQSS